MITGKAAILQYFDQVGKPYFAIFKKGTVEKGQPIFRNDKEEKDYDFTAGRESFDKTLQLLGYGDYTVAIDATKNVTNRGSFTVEFRIALDENNAPQQMPAVSGISGRTDQEIESMIEKGAKKMFAEFMREKENTDLKEKVKALETENRQLQKESGEPFNKFMTAISPHAPAIIAGFTGNPAPPISGVKPDAVGIGDTDAQKIMEDFIDALSEAKPNEWQQILQKLTTLIKNEPAKFETALSFI